MYTIAARNKMLDALGVTHVSLHSADPTDTGLNELASGNYARESITYNAASAGNIDSSNVPAVGVTAGDTVAYVGYWDALTGGTFLAYSAVSAPEVYSNDGTFTITDSDLDLNLVP